MRKRVQIALAVLSVVILSVLVWDLLRPYEPVYNGKRLSQWFDEYNKAGAMDKTEPISEAIRGIGTNSLPFLLAHIKHTDSPIKGKIFALFCKQQLVKLPCYGTDPYRSTSILALHALGSQAVPLLPDLLKLSEDTGTYWWGTISLLAIGTNSIPTLAKSCQSTNPAVRIQAALMMAMMKAMPPPWFSWGWNKEPLSGRPMFTIGYAVPEDDVRELVRMLGNSEAAVRRASTDAISRYTRPPYTTVARSAIPSLVQALHDGDQDVRQSAGQALKQIDPEAAATAGVK